MPFNSSVLMRYLHDRFRCTRRPLALCPLDQHMETHLQVAELCLPLLSPKDVAVLRCVCLSYRMWRVSWEAHGDIHFKLDGGPCSISWLHKNIVTITSLDLTVEFKPPNQLLQGLIASSSTMTHLCIKSQHITALPALPPQLQHLCVSGCSNLLLLPKFPPTLKVLQCDGCPVVSLPASFSSTAVTKLSCNDCINLLDIPELPGCITNIEANNCHSLQQLPQLPQGLQLLEMEHCGSLSELPDLPESLVHFSCGSCSSLRELPQLAHTDLRMLCCSGCRLLTDIPELPPNLDCLLADGLPRVQRLPELSPRGYQQSASTSQA